VSTGLLRIRARSGLLALLLVCMPAHPAKFGVGQEPSEALLQAWDIDISPSGAGLPAGSGEVTLGRTLYAQLCAACHGSSGEGGPMDRLVGGMGTLSGDKPVKTVGSFWPYATTLFDYIRRAMPFNAPQSLTNDQVYALTAYVLYLNGILGETDVLDARTLPMVLMPNRNGFVPDPRPDVRSR